MYMFAHTAPQNDLGLPEGWFSKNDIQTYRKLVSAVPRNGTFVEVGVWQGRSLCSVADEIRTANLQVYAVDTFKGTPSVAGVVHDCEGRLESIFQKNVAIFAIEQHLTVIKETSVAAATTFADKSVDLVFIDADHASDQVADDFSAWLPKVAIGGVLAGHDYGWVEDIIQSKAEQFNLKVQSKGDIWWISV